MAEKSMAVLIAGYPDIDTAEKDFDQLIESIKDKKVRTEGAILVERDKEGEDLLCPTNNF